MFGSRLISRTRPTPIVSEVASGEEKSSGPPRAFVRDAELLLSSGCVIGKVRAADRMVTINRTAIVVSPGQPFLDWLHGADPTSNELSLEDLQREPTVYLLPECENEKETREHLQQLCGQIFEDQLDGWYHMPASWPNRRDLDAFDRWFEWSLQSMVVDLCDHPLLHEEM